MMKIFNKLNVLFFTAILAGLFLIFYDTISFNDNLSLSNKKAVALVNETVITEDQFLRYATNLGADLDLSNDFEILDLLLERMIEEELLVQRGIELNLHKKDIGVRKEMITQVIDFIIQVEDNQITEADVRDYFKKNINKYAPTEKIKFDFIFLKSNNPNSVLLGTESDLKTLETKISNINLELDTKTFSEVKQKYNENNLFDIPQKLINLKDCEQLLGKGICNQITMMEINSISANTVIILFFLLSPLNAHYFSESFSKWNVVDNKVEANFSLLTLESTRIFQVENYQKIMFEENLSETDVFKIYLSQHLKVTSEGKSCSLVDEIKELNSQEGSLNLSLNFECPSNKEIKIINNALFNLVQSHIHIARIYIDNSITFSNKHYPSKILFS